MRIVVAWGAEKLTERPSKERNNSDSFKSTNGGKKKMTRQNGYSLEVH